MDLFHEYMHILSDPAHTLVELTFIMVDLLILKGVYHLIIRHFHRDLSTGRHRKARHKR